MDGQQRLRTILGFIDQVLVKDYNAAFDDFTISSAHNESLAGLPFKKLPREARESIVGYEIPVHVFSADTEDRDVLQIFARLNSTGVKLNDQELRNANFYGVFKTLCYEISYRHLERWEKWGVHDDAAISRMREVDEVSDLIISMHEGVHGKKQSRIDDYYDEYDASYKQATVVSKRFDAVMQQIDDAIGEDLADSEFTRVALFHSLFLSVYELMYGLGSALRPAKADKLPVAFRRRVLALSERLRSGEVSEEVAKSLRGATSDVGSRRQRVNFILAPFNRAIN